MPPQQQMAAEAKAEPSGAPSGAKGLPYRLVRGKWENVRKLRITHASAEAGAREKVGRCWKEKARNGCGST